MSDARWHRLQELFEQLIAMPADRRATWLDAQPDDDAIKREARALVAADESADHPITREVGAAAERLSSSPASGLLLGPYRLLHEIGAGGMGTVFLAERADAEFDRRVAIKLIRGIPTRDANERLRRERQILAKLEHPHIARLLDGGTSDDGQPYLVMEFVDGVPITTWCRDHASDLGTRLDLLRKVCLAVQYAHQRLVIHRDLKPANVLVRTDGDPALLDFGIAKLLDPQSSGPAVATAAQWFTPTYASPEQRRGEAVSTATDIHALGLLLAELASGQPPAMDADGHLPTANLVSPNGRPLPRELKLIIATAAHVDPERRYASAEILAEDLRRFQRGRPLLAAPDSVGYRARKFVQRHPIAALGIVAAIVVTMAFTWRLQTERDRALRAESQARQESAAAREVGDYLVSLFEAADPEQAGTRTFSARELVDRGRTELEQLGAASAQRGRLLATLGRVYGKLGLPEDARATLERALAALREQHADDEAIAATIEELGIAQRDLGEFPLSAQTLGEALAMRERLHGTDSTDAAWLRAELGLVLVRGDQVSRGVTLLESARATFTRTPPDDRHRVASTSLFLAEAYLSANRLDEARVAAERGVALERELSGGDGPTVIAALGFLANVMRAQNDLPAAERVLQQMLAARQKLLDPDSEAIALVHNELGVVYHGQGRLADAREHMTRVIEIERKTLGDDTLAFAIGLNNLASTEEELGNYARAETLLRQALSIAERHADEDAYAAVLYRQNLGRLLMFAGDREASRVLLEHPIPDSAGDSTNLALQRARREYHLGEWERRYGSADRARQHFDAAEKAFEPIVPAGHPRRAQLARSRGLVAMAQGDSPAAIAALRNAVEMLHAARGDVYPGTAEARVDLGIALAKNGERDEAATLLAAARVPIETQLAEGAPARKRLAELEAMLAKR